ncbi:MAG TPA: tRNA (adenosine(37)-N6)-dimethylallyltransferase MiaA [Bacteroidales bacterium]|nr:tRNA (adenosine(37)-N6)-dimethylallyltransferase MiaA [Bacteroidales bacterium]HRR49021.1 tRNA (adenosine(37)-N6)-dimethylallyltransferase MiaA [Bacteroidales bacterium]HRT32959.1 tRNA (adenosine(37)-N6)-dimethylallyltransferase MiaA [Bacteroidales bacterium]HRT83307.1 tRNA (adenosine(37)-N6)-dimethylallyltransferase MiaA [Bacteroidales bacterium]
MIRKRLTIIVGPTAAGKTDYAISLALKFGSPVISCDSRQIYREMKIGTAPPTPEQLSLVKHYFIFSHSIHDDYTAGQYEMEALPLIETLFENHDNLVMVGGSGLYVDAICKGMDDFPKSDPELRMTLMSRLKTEGLYSLRSELRLLDRESYDSIDITNPQRVIRALEVTLMTGRKFSSFKSYTQKKRNFEIEKIVVDRPREELYERINLRVEKMMEAGLLEEATGLYQFRKRTALKTVGYSELFDYIDGKVSLDEAVWLIKRNTRRYAKRQITWWRREGLIPSESIKRRSR